MTTPTVTLLTDFGTKDHYVGVMKGVIVARCPEARVIDITHEVEPYQIAQGAYLLSQAWRWFPPDTVHMAVVDPGVGGERRALAAEANGHRFVLPDNGILSLLSLDAPVAREIRNPALMLSPVSRTFHGRDIFAPAAASLAAGFAFAEVGPEVGDWVRLEMPRLAVLHVDRFGNVITNIRGFRDGVLRIGGTSISRFVESYSAAPRGELFMIEGSGGFVEISEREASAAARLTCRPGDPIILDDKS